MAKRPTAQKKVFNLLKPYKPPLTGWDKVYDWLIGKARVIMIVAEIIVAITFVIKVVVDTQAKALEDEIQRKNTELAQFQISTEPALRTMQNKVTVYRQLWNSATQYAPVLAELDSFIVNQGADLLVSINENQIIVSGEESNVNLELIELQIKSSPNFTEPQTASLNADTTTGSTSEAQFNAEIVDVSGRGDL